MTYPKAQYFYVPTTRATRLQPQGLQQPQWGGTNKLLPIFQGSHEVWELLISKDSVWTMPHQAITGSRPVYGDLQEQNAVSF